MIPKDLYKLANSTEAQIEDANLLLVVAVGFVLLWGVNRLNQK